MFSFKTFSSLEKSFDEYTEIKTVPHELELLAHHITQVIRPLREDDKSLNSHLCTYSLKSLPCRARRVVQAGTCIQGCPAQSPSALPDPPAASCHAACCAQLVLGFPPPGAQPTALPTRQRRREACPDAAPPGLRAGAAARAQTLYTRLSATRQG